MPTQKRSRRWVERIRNSNSYIWILDWAIYCNDLADRLEEIPPMARTNPPRMQFPTAPKQRYVYLAIMYSSYVGVAEYIVNTGLAVDVVPR